MKLTVRSVGDIGEFSGVVHVVYELDGLYVPHVHGGVAASVESDVQSVVPVVPLHVNEGRVRLIHATPTNSCHWGHRAFFQFDVILGKNKC